MSEKEAGGDTREAEPATEERMTRAGKQVKELFCI